MCEVSPVGNKQYYKAICVFSPIAYGNGQKMCRWLTCYLAAGADALIRLISSSVRSAFGSAKWQAFFSRMKYEALYRQTYSSIEEIDEEVSKYIDYYNNRRPHRRLNFKSPSEIEAAYYESLKA